MSIYLAGADLSALGGINPIIDEPQRSFHLIYKETNLKKLIFYFF